MRKQSTRAFAVLKKQNKTTYIVSHKKKKKNKEEREEVNDKRPLTTTHESRLWAVCSPEKSRYCSLSSELSILVAAW